MEYKKEEITKSFFENITFSFIKRSSPMVINIYGKNYHEFISKFQKPYDPLFIRTMQETLKYLCENINGCVLGYTKQFEFTLIIMPPSNIESSNPSLFNYDTQKIASTCSGMASMKFNMLFEKNAKSYVMGGNNFDETKKINAMQGYVLAIDKGAVFDANCFNIPYDDIFKYLHLKQKECMESSIIEVGNTFFSEKELIGKSPSDIQFMIYDKENINFDNYPSEFKRGSSCIRNRLINEKLQFEDYPENEWVIDREMPLLKDENKFYIDDLMSE